MSIQPSTLLKIIRYNPFKFNNPKRHLTITSKYSTRNIVSGCSKPAKPFIFTDYDCIGFDLDNTICKYKIGPMVKMEYEVLSKYLIEQKKYSPKYLQRPIEQNLDFMMKGLILDLEHGNTLKIDSAGTIVAACHGTHPMSKVDIENQYGRKRHWSVTDAYVRDVLATWEGPLSTKMRSLLDYFDMPVALVFARLVDTVDEQGKSKIYDLWPDILAGLLDMFDIKQFELNQGGYFPEIKANPEHYINKCSNDVIQWLKDLKEQNKTLFLLTGSYIDFASLTANTCLGDQWSSLFDVVIFQAKKPGFFTANRSFLSADTQKTIPGNSLLQNGFYLQGNWSDLHNFLACTSNTMHPRVAFVGDNLVQDIYAPSFHTPYDTVAICEELEAEGIFGFGSNHDNSELLKSKTWGSFFKGDAGKNDSFWMSIMKQYSRVCAPSIEYFARNPIHHGYIM